MKKQRNHSKLKDQETSPERTNETDLFSLIDIEFKKGNNRNTEGIKKGY